MKKPYWIVLCILFLAGSLLSAWLRPLALEHEARDAQIVSQLLDGASWGTPYTVVQPVREELPLVNWAQAVSATVVGRGALSLRLPGLLSSFGIALLLGFFVKRTSEEGSSAGLLSASVLVSCLAFPAMSASRDMLFAFLVGASLITFYLGCCGAVKRAFFLFLSGVFGGGAFLCEGFMAVLLPVIVFIPFLLWERRFRQIFTAPWLPLIGFACVVLPWSNVVYGQDPAFLSRLIWLDQLPCYLPSRILDSAEFQDVVKMLPGAELRSMHSLIKSSPVWIGAVVLLVGFLNWSALIFSVGSGLRRAPLNALHRFLLCWAIAPFLLFTAIADKNWTGLLPVFPPIAALVALGLLRYGRAGLHRSFSVGAMLMGAALILAAPLLALMQWGPLAVAPYTQGELLKPIFFMVTLLIAGIILISSGRRGFQPRRLELFVLGGLIPLFVLLFVLPSTCPLTASYEPFFNAHKALRQSTCLAAGEDVIHSASAVCDKEVKWVESPKQLRSLIKENHGASVDVLLSSDEYGEFIFADDFPTPKKLIEGELIVWLHY